MSDIIMRPRALVCHVIRPCIILRGVETVSHRVSFQLRDVHLVLQRDASAANRQGDTGTKELRCRVRHLFLGCDDYQ